MTKSDQKQQEKKQDEKQIDNKEVEILKTKNQELENQVKRVLADYQNLEKRVAEQRRELIMSANKDLLLKILPILDTLVLASKHSQDQSLQVSIQQFLDVLKNEGITKIKTENEDFDPNTMEAIGTKKGEEGKIIEEVRSGYMIGDKILRVAQVIVGSAEQNAEGK